MDVGGGGWKRVGVCGVVRAGRSGRGWTGAACSWSRRRNHFVSWWSRWGDGVLVVGFCVAVWSCGLTCGVRRVVQGVGALEAAIVRVGREFTYHASADAGADSTALLLSLMLTRRPGQLRATRINEAWSYIWHPPHTTHGTAFELRPLSSLVGRCFSCRSRVLVLVSRCLVGCVCCVCM